MSIVSDPNVDALVQLDVDEHEEDKMEAETLSGTTNSEPNDHAPQERREEEEEEDKERVLVAAVEPEEELVRRRR